MSKRNKVVVESAESKALKALRKECDLSIRKLADRMEISKTRVSQMESGREEINWGYVEKFLKALELSWQDWLERTGKKDNSQGLRGKCHVLLDSLIPSKLEKAYELLTGL